MTSRERFESLVSQPPFELSVERCPPDRFGYVTPMTGSYRYRDTQLAWTAWQASKTQAVKRCAKIAGALASRYRAVYKGRAGNRDQWHTHHTDGLCDGAGEAEIAIKAEFPEVFK